MSRTESTMVQLGTTAPDFELLNVMSGHMLSRDALVGAGGSQQVGGGVLVMFVCPHCPYVKHVEAELGRLGRDYADRLALVAIQSNDIEEYPQDGPDAMREQAERNGWPFPYLLDTTQAVARAYNAACTPDFFLFDSNSRLVYRGQLDGSRPRRGDAGNDQPVTGADLRVAIDAVLRGETPPAEQRTSLGCNIKWRAAPSA